MLLLALLVLSPVFMLFSKSFLPHNYIFNSLYKILFIVPFAFAYFVEKKSAKVSLFENFSFSVSLLGIGGFFLVVYLGTYFLLNSIIDIGAIAANLTETIAVNAGNVLILVLYMVFINSLLEEYFWRGFIYKRLRDTDYFSYPVLMLVTGVAFSFHHIMFFYDWFTWPLFLLATVGLTGFSIIVNYLFEKTKDMYSCWFVHACADVAQALIGLMVFGVI